MEVGGGGGGWWAQSKRALGMNQSPSTRDRRSKREEARSTDKMGGGAMAD